MMIKDVLARSEIIDGVPVVAYVMPGKGVVAFTGKEHFDLFWSRKKTDIKAIEVPPAPAVTDKEEIELHKELLNGNFGAVEKLKGAELSEKEKEVLQKLSTCRSNKEPEALFNNLYLRRVVDHLLTPTRIEINITQECNGRCLYCYAQAGTVKREERELRYWMDLVDEAADLDVCSITVSGGEPLLRWDKTYGICKRAFDNGMFVSILTNGTYLSKDVAKKLSEFSDRIYLQIDIDAPDKETHEYQRPGTNFEKVISAIDNVREEGIPFTLNTVVLRSNADKVVDMVKFAGDRGARGIKFMKGSAVGRGKDKKELTLSTEEGFALHALLTSLKAKDFGLEYITDTLGHPAVENVDCNLMKGKQSVCEAARGTLTIASDGRILPCGWLLGCDEMLGERYERGNLLDIWQHSAVYNEWRSIEVEGMCADCGLCGASCRAHVYLESGSLSALPSDCPRIAWKDEGKIEFYRGLIKTARILSTET
ncbi:MAG: radical SAM protein [Candidatus Thermoplasmatota archaeon]|nr:radical SAM protein [Candidatus Thermoplasmatota archaeon]